MKFKCCNTYCVYSQQHVCKHPEFDNNDIFQCIPRSNSQIDANRMTMIVNLMTSIMVDIEEIKGNTSIADRITGHAKRARDLLKKIQVNMK